MTSRQPGLRKLLPKPSSTPDSRGPGHDGVAASNTSNASKAPTDPTRFDSTGLTRKIIPVRNACNSCRKRKCKCDGTRPRCAACTKAGTPCEFVAPEGLNILQAERQQNAEYKSVIELISHGSLEELVQVLQRIREVDNSEEAVKSIAEARLLLPTSFSSAVSRQRNDDLKRPMMPLPYEREKRRLLSPFDDSDFMFERRFMADSRDQYVAKEVFVDMNARNMPLSRWTRVSKDDRLMNHLVAMFFTWDNVVERAIYRPILEEDVANMDLESVDSPSGNFCSQFLINALLAVSCLYTLDPRTFKDAKDPSSRGRRWADEAEALLKSISRPSISLLQGLYALFVYEGNIGLGTKSMQYLLRSTDVYKALNDVDALGPRKGVDEARLQRERQATSWCMWGFYCCEWRSSQAMGVRKQARKPNIIRAWREDDFPLSQADGIGYWWFPYPMSLQVQKSMQVEVREVDVLLAEIVEEALDFLYPVEGDRPPQCNPQRALHLYNAFVDWKLACPSRIRFEEAVLPSAILLHIAVDVMLIAILRPFSHMTQQQFGRFSPRERCYEHAGSIMSAVWTFRAFAHIRFEYWLNHAIGTAAYIVLREAEDTPIQMDTLIRACQCLHEMKVSLPLATDVLSGIYASFKRCNLQVPVYMKKYFEMVNYRKDGLMHHATASLLPSPTEAGEDERIGELTLQGLLDEFGDVGID